MNTVLTPGVHQWIVDAGNNNSSDTATEIQIRRGLDPVSITAINTHVTRALKVTYRRRMLLHQTSTMLITLVCLVMTGNTSNSLVRSLLATVPNLGAPWVFLVALIVLIVVATSSFQYRHRAWLRRSGGDVLWARAKGLGQLSVRSACLQISGAMLLAALLILVMMTGQ